MVKGLNESLKDKKVKKAKEKSVIKKKTF